MKAYLKNIIGAVALGLALLANTVPTWAGYASSSDVIIANNSASGAVQATRYSSGDTQRIGCALTNNQLGCQARDKNGVEHSCRSSDPKLMAVARAMTDHSYIYFNWRYDKPNECFGLSINNASYHLKYPK